MSGVQTRSQPSSIDPGSTEESQLKRLRALLEAAREARGGTRTELAGEVNRVLRMHEPGNEPEETRVLVTELDAHAFDDLVDADGVSSRKEAVSSLLSLGFPHALQVDPSDLEFARKEAAREQDRRRKAGARGLIAEDDEAPPSEYQRKLQRTRTLALILATLGSVPMGIYGLVLIASGSPISGCLGLLQLLLAIGPTAYLARVNPPLGEQATPIVGVVFATVLALILTSSFGWTVPSIALVGSAGALISLLGWQYDDPHHANSLFPPNRKGNPFDDSGRG